MARCSADGAATAYKAVPLLEAAAIDVAGVGVTEREQPADNAEAVSRSSRANRRRKRRDDRTRMAISFPARTIAHAPSMQHSTKQQSEQPPKDVHQGMPATGEVTNRSSHGRGHDRKQREEQYRSDQQKLSEEKERRAFASELPFQVIRALYSDKQTLSSDLTVFVKIIFCVDRQWETEALAQTGARRNSSKISDTNPDTLGVSAMLYFMARNTAHLNNGLPLPPKCETSRPH